jgi:hypothetical protein
MLKNIFGHFKNSKIGTKLFSNVSPKVWNISISGLLIIFLSYVSLNFIDSDLYYIIATGRNIIENHAVPHINPFISTPDYGIVIQNWLYCALVAVIYNIFHSFGLWILQIFFLLAMILIIFKFFGFNKSDKKYVILLIAAITIKIFIYHNLRPEMLTFCLIMLELIFLENYIKSDKAIYLYLIPLLMLVEINCHASYWTMHFVVLLPYIINVTFKSYLIPAYISVRKLKRAIIPFLLMIAIMFVNPYGIKNITYVYDALSSGVFDIVHISEQQPLLLLSWVAIFIITSIFIFILMFYNKKLKSTTFYMFIGTTILVFFAKKWVPFYSIGFLYLMRDLYIEMKFKKNYKKYIFCVNKLYAVFLISIITGYYAGQIFYTQPPGMFNYSSDIYMEKTGAKSRGYDELDAFCNYLDKNDPKATVFTDFFNSNYFEFRGYKVYYDARPELYTEKTNDKSSIIINAYAITSGINLYSYNKTVAYLSFDDYGHFLEVIDTDYYLISVDNNFAVYYLDNNKEKYELVLKSNNFRFYQKIN